MMSGIMIMMMIVRITGAGDGDELYKVTTTKMVGLIITIKRINAD